MAVEDNGGVHAYALNSDGSLDQVGSVLPGLGGVMALDYDETLGVLWAMCDDGCSGTGAQIAFDGTNEPTVRLIDRPTGLPDTNNEGFATSTLCVVGERSAWWFTDGVRPGALRRGALACSPVVSPTPTPTPSASPTPGPSASPSAAPRPTATASPSPSPTPSATSSTPARRPGLPSTGR